MGRFGRGGSEDPPDGVPDALREHVGFDPVGEPPRPKLVDELDAVAVNGGCELVGLDIEDPGGVLSAADRARAHGLVTDRAFIRSVLTSDAFDSAVTGLDTRDGFAGPDPDPDFEWFHATKVDGHAAWLLVRGGAYARFDGSQAEAKALGREFVDALFGDRYEDVACRRSTDQWSDWFVGIPHWDETLYLCDVRARRAWVLLLSDTD